jgi:hypothetical protein
MEKRITKLVNKFLKESFVDITDMDVNDAVDAVENVEVDETEMEEGNAFSGALAKAKEEGKDTFEVDGKTYKVQKEEINNKIKTILERRQKRLNSSKSKVKENKVVFSESELIDFIERIVEAETKEGKVTMKNLKSSKEVNDKAISDTNKKMKDYMKNMGMSYESDSDSFPKGNDKMSREGKDGKDITDDVKKAYKASKEIEEYIDNFTAAGLENLDYDNIKPNEDWVTDNIEGSSRTGNSPKYANAVETDVNKKINQKRENNLLAVLKRQAYNKAPQPVHTDEAGEVIPGTGESVPSSKEGKKNKEVNRILSSESVENKNVLKDIETMKNLFNYNKKTQ